MDEKTEAKFITLPKEKFIMICKNTQVVLGQAPQRKDFEIMQEQGAAMRVNTGRETAFRYDSNLVWSLERSQQTLQGALGWGGPSEGSCARVMRLGLPTPAVNVDPHQWMGVKREEV